MKTAIISTWTRHADAINVMNNAERIAWVDNEPIHIRAIHEDVKALTSDLNINGFDADEFVFTLDYEMMWIDSDNFAHFTDDLGKVTRKMFQDFLNIVNEYSSFVSFIGDGGLEKACMSYNQAGITEHLIHYAPSKDSRFVLGILVGGGEGLENVTLFEDANEVCILDDFSGFTSYNIAVDDKYDVRPDESKNNEDSEDDSSWYWPGYYKTEKDYVIGTAHMDLDEFCETISGCETYDEVLETLNESHGDYGVEPVAESENEMADIHIGSVELVLSRKGNTYSFDILYFFNREGKPFEGITGDDIACPGGFCTNCGSFYPEGYEERINTEEKSEVLRFFYDGEDQERFISELLDDDRLVCRIYLNKDEYYLRIVIDKDYDQLAWILYNNDYKVIGRDYWFGVYDIDDAIKNHLPIKGDAVIEHSISPDIFDMLVHA